MSISSDSSDNEDDTPQNRNNESPVNNNNPPEKNNLKKPSQNNNIENHQNNSEDNSEKNSEENSKEKSEENSKEKSKEKKKETEKKKDSERSVKKLLPIVPMTDFKCVNCLRFVSTINDKSLCVRCDETMKKNNRKKRFYPDRKLPHHNSNNGRKSRFYDNPCYTLDKTKNNISSSSSSSSSSSNSSNKKSPTLNKYDNKSDSSKKRLEDKKPKLLIFEINKKFIPPRKTKNNSDDKKDSDEKDNEEDEEEKKRSKKRSKSEDDRTNYYLDDDNWKKLENEDNTTVYEKNYNSIDELMNDDPFMELILRIEEERRRMREEEAQDGDKYYPEDDYPNNPENPERAPLMFYPNRNKGQKQNEKEKQSDENEEQEEEIEYEYQWLGSKVNDLTDLLKVIENHKDFSKKNSKKRKRYNLDIKQLLKLEEPLLELQKMIGLKTVKQNIFDQIIYYLQGLDNKNTDMLHTVIQGPPGVGKTHLSQIIAKIYKALGFLKSDKVVSVKRDDLIAGYLGQTAIKTRKKIKEALGGVLFIDEAYSLGDKEGRDSFSKEAIDVLTAYLSEHPHDLVCIIAGYKKALKERFFSQNEGLERRFTQRFNIDEYEPADLRLIFFKIVKDNEWDIENEEEIPNSFFETNKDYFIFNGGDMLTLFGCCKKAHAKRLMLIEEEDKLKEKKKKLNLNDVKEGMIIFLTNPEHAERCDKSKALAPFGMYL